VWWTSENELQTQKDEVTQEQTFVVTILQFHNKCQQESYCYSNYMTGIFFTRKVEPQQDGFLK